MATDALATGSLSARIPDASQLTGLLDELKTQAGKAKIPDLPLGQIQQLAASFDLSVPDTSSWSTAIPTDVRHVLSALPDAAALAAPLAGPLQRAKEVLAFPIGDELTRIETAITSLTPAPLDSPTAFLNGLIDPLADVASFFKDSELLKLSGTIAGFFGATGTTRLPDEAAAALSDVQTLLRDRVAGTILGLTGLASVTTAVARTERLVTLIGSSFSKGDTDARFRALLAAYGEGDASLAAAVRALKVDDPAQGDALRTRMQAATAAWVDFQAGLVRDLAISEASLALLDTGTLQDGLTQTAAALAQLQTAHIKALAESVRRAIAAIKDTFKVDAQLSLDELRRQIAKGLDDGRSAIDRIDLSKVRDALQAALHTIEAPFKLLEELQHTVETTVRTAMAEVSQALARIDLTPIHKAADQFLDQLGGKLTEVQALFASVRDAVESVLKEAAAALDGLRAFVLDPDSGLKKRIEDVFQSVFSLLDSLNIKGAVDEVSGILQPIDVELGKIEFAPVFDATSEAIDAVNTVLKTVAPLLVTDALKEKLSDATEFLRKVDFDQIGAALEGAFDEILAAVDEDALGAVKAEYQKVIVAIDRFDPAPALEDVQKEVFDPVIAELEQVKPAEALQPVQDGFDQVMTELRGFDPVKSLAFVSDFFAELVARFQEASPEKLLQPVEAELGEVKTQIERLLKIDQALKVLNQVTEFVRPLLDSVDVATVLDDLTSGFELLKSELALFDPAELLTPVAAALEAALTRAGATFDADGVIAALTAVAAKGAAIEERFAALPAKLSAAAAEIGSLDLTASLAALRARHDDLAAAVEAADQSAPIVIELDVDVAALDPVAGLTPIAAKAARVQSASAAKAAAFDRLVTSLGPSLHPAADIRDALASFLAAFDDLTAMVGNPFRALFGDPQAGPRDLLQRFIGELEPAKWRAQIEPLLRTLHDKTAGVLSDVVLNPLAEAAGSLKSLTGLLDISTLVQPITDVFDEVGQTIDQLNPAPIIQSLSERYQQLLATLDTLNPASFIADIQKLYADDLLGVIKAVSPADLLLPPLRELFDRIKSLLVSIDVDVLFKPILDRLKALKGQLVDGLGKTGAAYKQMLATLDSAGSGASASASVSVG